MVQKHNRVSLDSHLLFRIPDVIRYLLSPSLWMTLLGLAILSTVLQVMAFGFFGFFIVLFVIGIEIGVFFNITRSSAQGNDEYSPPEFTGIFDNVIHPIVLVIMASLPMLVALYWGIQSFFVSTLPFDFLTPGPTALFLLGALLFPLLLTVAAIDGTVGGILSPRIWVNALMGFRSNYIVAAAGFYGLWILEATFFTTLAIKIDETPIFGISVLALLVLYIPRVLRYRLLGALCEPHFSGRDDDDSKIPRAVVVSAVNEVNQANDSLLALQSGSMTPLRILRMANSAFTNEQYRVVYRATEYLWKNHPNESELGEALWLSAQSQDRQGQEGAMKATLQKLVAHDEHHPRASEARMKLRRYS